MRSFTRQIQDAVANCGKSRYRISKETGIHQAMLSRLMKGTGGLSMAALDKLAECIGMQVTLKGKGR